MRSSFSKVIQFFTAALATTAVFLKKITTKKNNNLELETTSEAS